MEELNKKLAEWAGFQRQTLEELEPKIRHEANLGWWIPRSEKSTKSLPDLTTSLDACFKWLVPKAIEKIKARHVVKLGDFGAYVILFRRWLDEGFDALALCKAIEKLIEAKNE